ncbi:MAG: SDR family oxidoreductase [Candidatus Nitronauta litoralis]|uniref:SDR family oxidoreductase n=1 Tax=Candidatus Nitronauta litoralis TaxID=2705533 RepID=A0A7T0G0D4_9BACT|nr:MAG: SDR family oxidoreductase [Candidatus Nitronauta litoralis]
MKIGITGASGQIGWHLRCHLASQNELNVVLADRSTFFNSESMDSFVSDLDILIHLAGVNRGEAGEIDSVNKQLAKLLIEALNRTGAKPHLVFSSSIHRDRHTAYGNAKRYCSERFADWSKESGALFTNMILPHVFGEHGKPFYNSVVHTFCHQIANNEKPQIINDEPLFLVHAQKVAERMLAAGRSMSSTQQVVDGEEMLVSQLLAKLTELSETYQQNIVPDLSDPLTLALFNTYRSYLYPKHFPLDLTRHSDNRGDLFELVKELNGGQVYVSTTKPGVTRGNHFHCRKFERFVVLKGSATICIRRMFTDEVKRFEVHGDQPQVLDIPTLHTHNLINSGQDELMTLFWANEIFDPSLPDTVREIV